MTSSINVRNGGIISKKISSSQYNNLLYTVSYSVRKRTKGMHLFLSFMDIVKGD
jgi:hypothetical protein